MSSEMPEFLHPMNFRQTSIKDNEVGSESRICGVGGLDVENDRSKQSPATYDIAPIASSAQYGRG